MKRKTILIAVAIAVASAGALLLAQTAQHGQMGDWHRHGSGGLMQHVTREFNLTDAQQTQVKAMWEAEKPNVVPLLQQLAQGHKEMVAATPNGTFDATKVAPIADQQAQTISKLLVEKEKLSSQFYQILTPEQRTKFDTMRQQHEARIDHILQNLASGGAPSAK
jgi:Spy/CpxP family protein refolding chaperone